MLGGLFGNKRQSTEELQSTAMNYYREGNYKKAVIYFEKIAEITPNDFQNLYYLAFCYFHLQDFTKALQLANKSLLINPSAAHIFVFRCSLHIQLSKFQEALNDISAALRLEPNDTNAIAIKKRLEEQLGVVPEDTDSEEEDLEDEDDEEDEEEESELDERTQKFYDLAHEHYDDEEYEEALEYFLKVEKKYPEYETNLFFIGKTYLELQEYDEAIAYAKKCLKIDKTDTYNRELISEIYMGMEDYDLALPYLEKLYAENSENDTVCFNLGLAYYHEENDELAIKYLKEAVDLEPEVPSYQSALALAYYTNGVFDKALKCFKRARKLDPEGFDMQEYIDNIENDTVGEAGEEEISENKEIDSGTKSKPNEEVEEDERIKSLLIQLDEFVGMGEVKDSMKKLIKFIEIEKEKMAAGLTKTTPRLHTVFYGPPGTGKTTIARTMGSLFKEMGLLKKGHLVEVNRSNLVGEGWGSSAPKTAEVINSALDGVLFIDEAYTLKQSEDDVFGKEAIDELLKKMEDHKDRLIVIVAGYYNEMQQFIESNPGLKSRFTKYFNFRDYTPEELHKIFYLKCGKYKPNNEADEKLKRYFEFKYHSRQKDFGNGRFVDNLLNDILSNQSERLFSLDRSHLSKEESIHALTEITLSDVENTVAGEFNDSSEESLEAVLKQLDEFVGMESLKEQIYNLVSSMRLKKAQQEKGIHVEFEPFNAVFYGPPGTGKTTVARVMGRILKLLGISALGHVVEVDRSKLVGSHIGETDEIARKVIESAFGGVLFIDEAYSLVKKDAGWDYGTDALNILLKQMEDNRDKLVVIIAGYKKEINEFLETNPGLKSRFTHYFDFNDYTPKDLLEIFMSLCKGKGKNPYLVTDEAQEELLEFFNARYTHRDKNFGNGRFVRNVFNKLKELMGRRLNALPNISDLSAEELLSITTADVKHLVSQYGETIN